MIFSVQQLIDNTLEEKNKERVNKSQVTWHASSLGSCLCGVYLNRLGIKPVEFDKRTLRVFDMGNKIEDWVVELIKKQDKYEIKTQQRIFNEEYNFSGYDDVEITDKETGETEIWEIKSKHSRSFWYMDKKGQGAMIHHQMQLWSYLNFREAGKIEKGKIIYISKDDSCILEYPIFLNNSKLRTRVLDQLNILNKAWKFKTPPPPAPEGSWQAKYCNNHEECLKQEKYLNIKPLFYQDLEDELKHKEKKKIKRSIMNKKSVDK